MTRDELIIALNDFIDGRDRLLAQAGRIEVALYEMFGDKEPFASATLDLASYRPEGGPYLHDAEEMAAILRALRDVVEGDVNRGELKA